MNQQAKQRKASKPHEPAKRFFAKCQAIRSLRGRGLRLRDISVALPGISISLISRVCRREIWAHVDA
jgi:hypothetical protein